MSTAHDMTILGRHVLYDYPQYYNLFSRRTTDAGIREVANTNRRLLASYKGADGIKTGYTRAAGSNLVASAERGTNALSQLSLVANHPLLVTQRLQNFLILASAVRPIAPLFANQMLLHMLQTIHHVKVLQAKQFV